MLEDADYEEMEADMRKIKASQWANDAAANTELDADDDDDENHDDQSDKQPQLANNDGQSLDEYDYEAKAVPVVTVQLDSQSEEVAANAAEADLVHSAASSEARNAETADKVAAFMDVMAPGESSELAAKVEKEDEKRFGTFQFFRSLLPGGADREDATEEKAANEVNEKQSSDVDAMNGEQDGEEMRKKRLAGGEFDDDDDYKTLLDDDDDYRADFDDDDDYNDDKATFDDDDDYRADAKFDQDDYGGEEDGRVSRGTQLDDDDDYSDMEARQQIDREYENEDSAKKGRVVVKMGLKGVSRDLSGSKDIEFSRKKTGRGGEVVDASERTIVSSGNGSFSLRREIIRCFDNFWNAFFGKSIIRMQKPSTSSCLYLFHQ